MIFCSGSNNAPFLIDNQRARSARSNVNTEYEDNLAPSESLDIYTGSEFSAADSEYAENPYRVR
ncbi:MAG: hypothetical protein WBW85_16885 [Terriglobales bacterium]